MVTYPHDWVEKRIVDLTEDVITGGTPSTLNPAYWDGDIPWIASAEINRKFIEKPTRYITNLGLSQSSAKIAPGGSVLIALAGQGKTRGTAAYLASDMAVNQSLAALLPNETTDVWFLLYLLENNYAYLREVSSGDGGRGGLNKKLIKGLSFIIPRDKNEQVAIGKALRSLDEYISDLAALIEKKKAIREGAVTDLMTGKTRLAGFHEDWVIVPFGEFFAIQKNNTYARDQLADHGTVGNIHYGDVLIKYGDTVSESDEIPFLKPGVAFSEKWLLQKNDVVIADTAEDETVGKAIQIGDISFPLVGGLHTIVCRPLMETAPGFLGFYINSRAYHDQLLPHITGIKVSSVSKKSIKLTEVRIPGDIKEQQAIAETLAAMDAEIASLTAEREKMIQIREGAMNDLLTGRVRLSL